MYFSIILLILLVVVVMTTAKDFLPIFQIGVWPLTKMKRRMIKNSPYKCYYIKEKEMKKDKNAQDLANVSQKGYTDSRFDSYFQMLSEYHFPQIVLVNWTKSIAEELMDAISPIHYVKKLDRYFRSGEVRLNMSSPDYVEFEDYELSYLWGAVYYWLKCLTPGFDNQELLDYIEKIACPKLYLKPYFLYFKGRSEGTCEGDETLALEEDPSGQKKGKCLEAGPACCLLLGVSQLTEDSTNKSALEPVVAKLFGGSAKYIHTLITGSLAKKHKEDAAKAVETAMPKLAEKIRKL